MIKIEKTQVVGWEPAIRGMRNPMNSWEKSDSTSCYDVPCSKCHYFVDSSCTHKTPGCNFAIGPNDHDLMLRLAKAGSVEGKFRRMIVVYIDITAPLYWWKEFDTYKVGTVANSCSTMHKIHAKEFTMDDFSHEHLQNINDPGASFDYACIVRDPKNKNELTNGEFVAAAQEGLKLIVDILNTYRQRYLRSKEKIYWWQMIQLLPSNYNQKRTVMLNYEALSNIYCNRCNHKLDEWRELCKWIESLPYSEIITCNAEKAVEVKDLDTGSIYPANYITVNLTNGRNTESNDLISRSALLKEIGDPNDGMVWPSKHGIIKLVKEAPAVK